MCHQTFYTSEISQNVTDESMQCNFIFDVNAQRLRCVVYIRRGMDYMSTVSLKIIHEHREFL